MKKYLLLLPFLILSVRSPAESLPLLNKVICVDPGHGGTAATDHYRQGRNGEREEWINLRVALLLKKKLEAKGARVILTRDTDIFVKLEDRAAIAVQQKADLFISIHHNATADTAVNFPIIYFHGAVSENLAGVALGKILASAFERFFYSGTTPKSLLSDYVIFPTKGSSVLRGTYGIPGVLAEASFFTNPAEEQRLKQPEYNEREAQAYVNAISEFFKQENKKILAEKITLQLPPFAVLEEAQRTSPVALNWEADFREGIRLSSNTDTGSHQMAYDLFSRSARSFPDSYVSGKCHQYMASLLRKMKKDTEAKTEEIRAKELFVPLALTK